MLVFSVASYVSRLWVRILILSLFISIQTRAFKHYLMLIFSNLYTNININIMINGVPTSGHIHPTSSSTSFDRPNWNPHMSYWTRLSPTHGFAEFWVNNSARQV